MRKLILAGIATLIAGLSLGGCYVEERRPYRYGHDHRYHRVYCDGWGCRARF
jgi:hypothetical protein